MIEVCLPKEAFARHDGPSPGSLDERYTVPDVTSSIDVVKLRLLTP